MSSVFNLNRLTQVGVIIAQREGFVEMFGCTIDRNYTGRNYTSRNQKLKLQNMNNTGTVIPGCTTGYVIVIIYMIIHVG